MVLCTSSQEIQINNSEKKIFHPSSGQNIKGSGHIGCRVNREMDPSHPAGGVDCNAFSGKLTFFHLAVSQLGLSVRNKSIHFYVYKDVVLTFLNYSKE